MNVGAAYHVFREHVLANSSAVDVAAPKANKAVAVSAPSPDGDPIAGVATEAAS